MTITGVDEAGARAPMLNASGYRRPARRRRRTVPDRPIDFPVDFDVPDVAPASTAPVAKLGPVAVLSLPVSECVKALRRRLNHGRF